MRDTAHAPQPPTNPPIGHQMSRQGLAQNDQKCQIWAKFGRFFGKNHFSAERKNGRSKPTKFGPKLAFLFILGQALPAHLVPCWWVGWWLWRAGCISQDTYLLYQNFLSLIFFGCTRVGPPPIT